MRFNLGAGGGGHGQGGGGGGGGGGFMYPQGPSDSAPVPLDMMNPMSYTYSHPLSSMSSQQVPLEAMNPPSDWSQATGLQASDRDILLPPPSLSLPFHRHPLSLLVCTS